jgi:hypothetical protein
MCSPVLPDPAFEIQRSLDIKSVEKELAIDWIPSQTKVSGCGKEKTKRRWKMIERGP